MRVFQDADFTEESRPEPKRAAAVFVVAADEHSVLSVSIVAAALGGKHSFVALGGRGEVAAALAALPWGPEGAGLTMPPDAVGGALVVASASLPEVLARPLGALGPGPLTGEAKSWLTSSVWPLVARFDPSSAAQGDRIKSSGVSVLCVLVGEEEDFMFADFKSSLLEAAKSWLGKAHFLFADRGEARIAPLVRASRAPETGPCVILISMEHKFPPTFIEGAAISPASIGELLSRIHENSGHSEL